MEALTATTADGRIRRAEARSSATPIGDTIEMCRGFSMMNRAKLPCELVKAFRQGTAAVFVGAGASTVAGLPTWNALVSDLAQRLDIQPDRPGRFSPNLLSMVPQFYENQFGRIALIHRLQSLIPDDPKLQSQVHELLAQLPTDLFYTTNFDELLEAALNRQEITFDRVVSEATAQAFTQKTRCQVRKIHGTITQPDTLVITRSDYARFVAERPLIVDGLRNDLTSRVFLFVGYSLTDPDFSSIYDHVFYAMQPMNLLHFLCVFSPAPYEIQDLRARGMATIDLELWPGEDRNEKLMNFMTSLVNSTSEVVHIRRFFRGIQRGQHLPIVITSHLNEAEQFVYYPACDIHVGHQVEKALLRIGCTSEIVPDRLALEQADHYRKDDLVLVCSPLGNAFTRHIFELAERQDCSIRQRFIMKQDRRCVLEDPASGRVFEAEPVTAPTKEERKEYALIARYHNPWNPERHIFVFAGLDAMGTHVIGDFLADMMNYQRLPWQGEDVVTVLEISYAEHDPFAYRYRLERIIDLSQGV